MGPMLGHEESEIDTAAGRPHKHDKYARGVAHTYVDGANPLCFFIGAECSPFPAYSRLVTRVSFTRRARHPNGRPKDSHGDGKEFQDEHTSSWAGGRRCDHVGEVSRSFYSPQLNESVLHEKSMSAFKGQGMPRSGHLLYLREAKVDVFSACNRSTKKRVNLSMISQT
jgi:hypothetical protein